MTFMEEIAVWKKLSANIAVRYVGFRNIETGAIWFSCANYLSADPDEGGFDGDVMGYESITSIFLSDIPGADSEWKPNMIEALEHFLNKNPEK